MFFEKARQFVDIEPEVLELIRAPDAALRMNIPLRRDDGSI